MLKIKDNVDLKELEKYGFIDEEKRHPMHCYYSNHNLGSKICVGKINKKIWIEYFADKELNIIYDLIKANLVEKVDQE